MLHKIKTAWGIMRLFKDWPKFMLYYFGLRKGGETVFRFRNGLRWHVDTDKRGFAVIGDVWIQRPYALLETLKDPKIIFDLGAHIGSFSILAAKRFPHARIHAFEASRENFALLEKNLRENGITNVHAHNIGIGSRDGKLDFFIDEKNTVLNSFRKGDAHSTMHYKVSCRTLKTLFKEYRITECDFMKIDIEGMEYDIIAQAAKDGTLRRISALATEIIPDSPEFRKAEALLKKNGFRTTIKKDIINAVRD